MNRCLIMLLGMACVLLGTPLGLRGLDGRSASGEGVVTVDRALAAGEHACCCEAHPMPRSAEEACPCGDDSGPVPSHGAPCRSTCPCAPTPSRGDRTAPATPLVDHAAAARAREGAGRTSAREGRDGERGDGWPGFTAAAGRAERRRLHAAFTAEILRAGLWRAGVADRSVRSVWTT